MVRIQSLPLLLGMTFLAVLSARAASPQSAHAADVVVESGEYTEQLLGRLNAARSAAGVGSLTLLEEADDVAVARSVDMATLGYFSHYSPSGAGAYDLLKQRGVSFRRMGENIAEASYPPGEIVDIVHTSLMASPGHLANIMEGGYHRVGIGVASVNGAFYVTYVFLD